MFDSENKSVFNMALANLERLNHLINSIDMNLFDGDYNSAYRQMLLFKSDLASHITKKEEKEEISKMIDNLSQIIAKYNDKKIRCVKTRKGDELFFRLNEMKEYLIRIMQRSDMLMPSKDDPAHAMLR